MSRQLSLCLLMLLGLSEFGNADPLRIYGILYRGETAVEKGFQDYFREQGIDVQYTWRNLNRDKSKLPGFVQEIRQQKPDLVYTWGTTVTLGVLGAYDSIDPNNHITDIPVVFTLVAAPVRAKIVEDMSSSNRNVTGVTVTVPIETQIRAIESYRPFNTLGILYTPTEKNSVVFVEDIRKLGEEMGFKVVANAFHLDANNKPVVDGAEELLSQLKNQGAQWLYLPPDSFLGSQAKTRIIPEAMRLGLPTFASTEQLMSTGALAGLVSRYQGIGRFTAHKVKQILVDKIPPARISMGPLSRFSFQINLDAVKQLKLPPPLQMLNYAEILNGETE
ncbi:ABC transporter substrate-binding protein [Motiliproteus sp. MSK22-1]|uniref:ABC transporter substrate-binding protein n=1 Tax=Motiliproteus sp. MSK22-1 TaxID=1897630 RepID=UPI000975C53C|nr:ABC transporter substrate-binding protein [Motiliproteus sp. MSK22-1]OMH30295.1 hypothetical protein BGP75_18060 [Motiliproteus sp. MSK22-1]